MKRSNEELALLIQQGQTELYSTLYKQVQRFLTAQCYKVYNKYCDRYRACGIALEDLEQELFFVLVDMVQAYDSNKPYKLLTYANILIRNRLVRNILGYGKNKKAEPLDTSVSLDKEIISEDTTLTIKDTIKDDTAEAGFTDIIEQVFNAELRCALEKAIDDLPEQSRQVIRLYYFKGYALGEIGNALNISQQRAAQIRKTALSYLRKHRYENKLREFEEYYISTHAYYNTGYSSFLYSGGSSQEITIERLESIKCQRSYGKARFR